MKKLLLVGGIASFVLSFMIHQYYMQLMYLGILLLAFYLLSNYLMEMGEFKAVMKEHTELMKQDIERLKK